MLQLSCYTKKQQEVIRHENCNTKSKVSSSNNRICRQIRRHKGSKQVRCEPAIHLPLEKTLRWNAAIPCGQVTPTAASPESAHGSRTETHCRYEKAKRQYRISRVLGQAPAERLYAVDHGIVSGDEKDGLKSREAAESQVYPQAV